MPYAVKTIFYTIQGEGINAGRAAVFIRFAGCNLWSGREEDRQKSICTFCDTDFVGTDGPGGGHFATADALVRAVTEHWPNSSLPSKPFVVCTGGEPLLQLDTDLIQFFHHAGFEIAIETNGTQLPPDGIDWICVSPKAGAPLRLNSGNEFKLVFPQQGVDPEQFADLDFQHFLLQPMDGPEREANTRLALEYCLAHPQWRIGLQAHKVLGIP
jgi:7-carboxy-7-deazaguanine synthase (Cx14CxxC type)